MKGKKRETWWKEGKKRGRKEERLMEEKKGGRKERKEGRKKIQNLHVCILCSGNQNKSTFLSLNVSIDHE